MTYAASTEYKEMMSKFLFLTDKRIKPIRPWYDRLELSMYGWWTMPMRVTFNDDYETLGEWITYHAIRWLRRIKGELGDRNWGAGRLLPMLPPLTREAKIFQSALCQLDAQNRAAELPAMPSASFAFPEWMEAHQVKHAILAAEHLHIGAKAFSARLVPSIKEHGLDLCMNEVGFGECGRRSVALTVALRNDDRSLELATFETHQHPARHSYINEYRSHDLDDDRMEHTDLGKAAQWVEDFASSRHIDAVILVEERIPYGNMLAEAVKRSSVKEKLLDPVRPPQGKEVVYAMAKMAKGLSELNTSGCRDADECFVIRDEADRIGGIFPNYMDQDDDIGDL